MQDEFPFIMYKRQQQIHKITDSITTLNIYLMLITNNLNNNAYGKTEY
jgi:hypothetical protein